MKIKTVYIDDEEEELRKYARIFENDERAKSLFEIVAVNSQKEMAVLVKELKSKNPELILVDYRLDKPTKDVY
jgi:hypothetical protein